MSGCILDEYQILARSIDHQLGKNFSTTEITEIEVAISQSRSVVSQAELHGVAPFFYEFIKYFDLRISEQTRRQLQSLTLRHKLASEARAGVLTAVINQFVENQIDLVLLKGVALAQMIYRKPLYRPMHDMDILIRQADLNRAQTLLEEQGFIFEQSYPSIFMGDIHHLPNAIKTVNIMKISLEVHHEVYSRDVVGSQSIEQIIDQAQAITMADNTKFLTLDHISMLSHLCRHSFALSPRVRLIHQHDIVKYAQTYLTEIPWQKLSAECPFVINTLKCLHYSIFIPEQLRHHIGKPYNREIRGIGQAMLPYTHILNEDKSLLKRLKMLFNPSPWWMHVNYNVAPEQSLLRHYIFDHPKKVISDITNRLFHALKNILGNIKS